MFQEFFEEFDKELDRLDIMSYGISMTTLEEVFIAANEAHREGENGSVITNENDRMDKLMNTG